MRVPISEKYSTLPNLWAIDQDLVLNIIRKYEKLFQSAQEDLKTNRFQLPAHFKDRRSDIEYIYDIMDGWLMEDIICHAWLKPQLKKINPNIEIKVMGTDRDRVIQKYNPKAITTEPDLIFSVGGEEKRIDALSTQYQILV